MYLGIRNYLRVLKHSPIPIKILGKDNIWKAFIWGSGVVGVDIVM